MINKDTPLQCEVTNDGLLVIKIGVDTLAFAAENYPEDPCKVLDAAGFTKDVIDQIIKEDEIGESLITNMLDKAILNAKNSGSIYVKYE